MQIQLTSLPGTFLRAAAATENTVIADEGIDLCHTPGTDGSMHRHPLFPAAWLHRTDVPGGFRYRLFCCAVAPPATSMKIKASLERILVPLTMLHTVRKTILMSRPETPVLQIPHIILYPFFHEFRIGGGITPVSVGLSGSGNARFHKSDAP